MEFTCKWLLMWKQPLKWAKVWSSSCNRPQLTTCCKIMLRQITLKTNEREGPTTSYKWTNWDRVTGWSLGKQPIILEEPKDHNTKPIGLGNTKSLTDFARKSPRHWYPFLFFVFNFLGGFVGPFFQSYVHCSQVSNHAEHKDMRHGWGSLIQSPAVGRVQLIMRSAWVT